MKLIELSGLCTLWVTSLFKALKEKDFVAGILFFLMVKKRWRSNSPPKKTPQQQQNKVKWKKVLLEETGRHNCSHEFAITYHFRLLTPCISTSAHQQWSHTACIELGQNYYLQSGSSKTKLDQLQIYSKICVACSYIF